MKVRIKSTFLFGAAAFALCAVACSPKPADSDAAVGDAFGGDAPMDVVIPLTDSAADDEAEPDVGDAAEIVDVEITPDTAPGEINDAIDTTDAINTADVVDIPMPPDLPADEIADTVGSGDADIADGADAGDVADVKANDAQLPVPDLGPCVSKDLVLYADSLSDDGTCTSACKPDHPCICGDCAWVQTPPLVQPRWGASAVWTGTEIVVVGGSPGGIGYKYPITAERWNPKTGKGFEMIDTPPTKPTERSVEAHWDGTYVWAIVEAPELGSGEEEYSFRWDLKTNAAAKLAMKGRSNAIGLGFGRATVWAAGQFFEEGAVLLPKGGGVYGFSLYSTSDDAWQAVPFPDNLIMNNYLNTDQIPCLITSGDDVFIYNSGFKPAPAAGLDAKKAITLQFHVSSKTWSVISQAMPIDPIKFPCGSRSFEVGTDAGFVIWGSNDDNKAKYGKLPAQGAIYNKITDAWTVMPLLAANAYASQTTRQFAVVGDVIYAYGQMFLDESKPVGLKFVRVNAVAEFHLSNNSWDFLTPVGFPTDHRSDTAFVVGDNELYLIGGSDGPPDAMYIHKDGVRLALPGSKP